MYIYTYIYIKRERERERESNVKYMKLSTTLHKCVARNSLPTNQMNLWPSSTILRHINIHLLVTNNNQRRY